LKTRVLTPELLDSLPPEDPAAQGSRGDLRRLHPLLGQNLIWRRWFSEYFPIRPPSSLADLGTGDGFLLCSTLLRTYPAGGHGARIFLVDRQPVLSESTLDQLRRRNWLPTVVSADALVWLEEAPPMEAILTNLFLHHFNEQGVTRLFSTLARKTSCFAAAEPRRSRLAWLASSGLRWLGFHPVTRHDARVSVEAGFRDHELSALWPRDDWRTHEEPIGPFTHFFSAHKLA